MATDRKKQGMTDIDEDLMMNLMVDGVKTEGLRFPIELNVEPEQHHQELEKHVQKKTAPAPRSSTTTVTSDYESLFLKKTDTAARDGKTVYIRPEFHEKLSRIVQVIGEDKISIYTYMDNVLNHHFDEFGDQITKSYHRKHKPI